MSAQDPLDFAYTHRHTLTTRVEGVVRYPPENCAYQLTSLLMSASPDRYRDSPPHGADHTGMNQSGIRAFCVDELGCSLSVTVSSCCLGTVVAHITCVTDALGS